MIDEGVERQVTLPAAREDVWTSLTDPDEVGAWFEADVDWDLRPGGDARFLERNGSQRSGTVVTVRDAEVLRFRWWPVDEEGHEPASEVTYTLEDVPEGTRLTVTEEPLDTVPSPGVPTPGVEDTASACVNQWDFRLLGLMVRSEARVSVHV